MNRDKGIGVVFASILVTGKNAYGFLLFVGVLHVWYESCCVFWATGEVDGIEGFT